ncbi:MAG: cysteine--tRNA ligase [Chlamydiales bacterium]
MVELLFFNSETNQKEILKPLEEGHVRMYTCGPTIYDFAHIGNFRTYVFEDLLRRTLKYFDFKVTQVMNITDVDDKTIRRAVEQDKSLQDFTAPFKKAFFEDLKTLGIEPVEYYPCATDYIDEMIAMIEKLLDKGYAYRGNDGSIYFAISRFSRYGCLSHLKLDELQTGASQRVSSDEYDKESASDFVLWKSYDAERDGPVFWDSTFGKGRPGWHLECSAMATEILGDSIDIHCGGVDNKFPHHENEIAQCEAVTGQRFVRIWMHAEHLIVENKKMSKSLGNFYTLRDLLEKGYQGVHVRYLLLQTHYKTQLNFTFEGLEAAKGALQRINDFVLRMQELEENSTVEDSTSPELDVWIEKAKKSFSDSLADDLNISEALAAIFDFIREVNALSDQQSIGSSNAKQVLDFLKHCDTVLNVMNFQQNAEEIPKEIVEAQKKREEARKEKNWELADRLRDFIHEKGYVIEDTAKGVRLKKK